SAGIMAATDVVSSHPSGFATIAVTLGHGCVFSWASDVSKGLANRSISTIISAPRWVRLTRVGNTYVGSCSADGVEWTIVGSAVPGGLGGTADVGMFASAGNGGASDRLTAAFDNWTLVSGNGNGNTQMAVEYFHASFGHYFFTA